MVLGFTGLPAATAWAKKPAPQKSPKENKAPPEDEAPTPKPQNPEESERLAEAAFQRGFALQKDHRTLEALAAYEEALTLNPFHAQAQYEIGWSYWVLGRWDEVIQHWEVAQQLKWDEPELGAYLQKARDQASGKIPPLSHPAIGTRSTPLGAGGITLEVSARFQHFNPQPESSADHFDGLMFSPKSVAFSPDGTAAYVNALEGDATLVFNPQKPRRVGRILHEFGPETLPLFPPTPPVWGDLPPGMPLEQFNTFIGNPVEFAFSHQGRYLWVPYYRRSFDSASAYASAVAVIDTQTRAMVRVMDTGPIPKVLAASPDGRWMAVIHWGDNTVGLIDIHGDDPAAFHHDRLIVVEKRLTVKPGRKINRDHACGLCLRGAVFTPDSGHLLVARMGGGGIAVINVEKGTYLGSVDGMKPTPRHFATAPGGRLYVSSSFSGAVSMYAMDDLVTAATKGVKQLPPLKEGKTGDSTRTIALSPDGRWLFAAINQESRLLVLDANTLAQAATIPSDSFPVGLAVSPDGRQVWLTAQGRQKRGGNAVTVFKVLDPPKPTP
ncbi:MAG: beta-propeller fold lactonase family protein [Deltaproteobacteria bacterium]|nr:beta-propeller fold lactonase family protein [Deltaproteobacteria bacterium]